MKSFLKTLLILFLIISNSKTFCCHTIVVVNIKKIFQEIPQNKIISETLEYELKPKLLKLKKMKENFILKKQNLKKQNNFIPLAEKTKIEQEILKLKNVLLQYEKLLKIDIQNKNNKAKKEIFHFIQQIINQIAKKNNYNMVLDISLMSYINKNVIDITDEVILQAKQK
ncbi:OmpH family outer membrane protein [Enterobacteriaceae endosymbiont of Neohaemonia nigricornis]|uniref:OmpH family outer membrane protein n=1 Tax=Enterobacteriaceae endosymbiont of Neohaemonia nigricornis TaxID=2675792 RepID=UPI001449E6CD|nr:OmpH family outer membrane protein [Enterobacteriaceae endosymbiont of Neohaemonia nigricornis]QJC30418.1 hypothetical protein GJT85_01140 [Enterobacteriaceae endosymbiont of Neohaemonia nigricornis]